MIAGTGYIKSANDESLARDEGGGHNLFMEVVTYKTVQGRQLRMTPAIATFFPSMDAAELRTIVLLHRELCANPTFLSAQIAKWS